ncbi:hypothetical protein SeLEV6574_g04660 [Synchytrium endobioticum]|uniref:Uncharacterized protein n=1 Tax=Synchytrium endobioticum TaxID=286115 RepID=A0A507CYG0_9FUNG|nr:hypothetical protein SeLEV6574_g04660 [Synchytrium endobioticum]
MKASKNYRHHVWSILRLSSASSKKYLHLLHDLHGFFNCLLIPFRYQLQTIHPNLDTLPAVYQHIPTTTMTLKVRRNTVQFQSLEVRKGIQAY